MYTAKIFSLTPSRLSYVVSLLTGCLLLFSLGAHATAPRVSAEMFGEEKHADIVGYQYSPSDEAAQLDSAAITEIIAEAFKAANAKPTVDMLPSKQVASYALINNEAVGFIGTPQDLGETPKNKYLMTRFFFKGDAAIALIVSNSKQGKMLHEAFNQGLQKIIKSGKYAAVLENRFGKGQVPADYLTNLKKQNPSWK